MDLRKHGYRTLPLLVALMTTAASAETSLWLVRPLYPGQEALVARTEGALDKLMPGTSRKDATIGIKELASAVKGHKFEELPCFAQSRCADPIDPFFASLGFDRIVLIQGGQDEAGFKFRVVSYEPKEKRVMPASATNANLEKALLGAVAKVVPAASSLEVKSTPPGATVYVDDVKVGVTPLSTQVLPGERMVRLDLKLHQPVEEAIVIPIRGTAELEKTLEKVAARIVITASPAGTDIFIDGHLMAKDRVDRGISPGSHTVRLVADKHKAFEQQVTVKADEQYVLDKTLEPIQGVGAPVVTSAVDKDGKVVKLIPPPPPEPPTPTQLTYDRRSYFQLSFEYGSLIGNSLVARRFGDGHTGRTERILSTPAQRALLGASLEYGTFGKYFGLTVFGLSYLTNADNWSMSVSFGKGQAQETNAGVIGATTIDPVRVNMVTLRALQPQVRFAVWRFQFSVQLGFEFRSGQVLGTADSFYENGFMLLDLMASARLNARFYVVDGLYLMGQANYTQYLLGESTNDDVRSSSSWGFNAGVGFGF